MLLRDIFRRSGRSIKNAKGRTLLTAFAIAVGAFALTLTLAASNGATSFVNKIISDNFDPAELLVSKDEAIFGGGNSSKPREYDANFTTITTNAGTSSQIKLLTDDDIAVIKKTEGVERVRQNVIVNLQYITRPEQKKYVGNLTAQNPFQKPESLAGNASQPVPNQSLLLPEGYLSALGFKSASDALGKTVTLAIAKPLTQELIQQSAQGLASQSPDQLQSLTEQSVVLEEFKVAAVLKKPATAQPGTELYLYVNQEEALRLQDISTAGTTNFHKYSYVNVRIADGQNSQKLVAAQDALKQQGFQTQSVKDTQKFLTNIIGVLQGIVFGFGLIAIIASVFGIVNTMYISVLQRTREIGLMKALGMQKRDIGRLFRFEAAWIGFLGGLIGSVLAIGLGSALNPWITQKLSLGDGNSILIFKPLEVVALVTVLMVVSILAGWLPSRKAAKLDPIEALRTE